LAKADVILSGDAVSVGRARDVEYRMAVAQVQVRIRTVETSIYHSVPAELFVICLHAQSNSQKDEIDLAESLMPEGCTA
jgi:hypothetical protein